MAHLQLKIAEGSNQTSASTMALQSYVFTEIGGNIGRSADCDWVVDDGERFISNKHIAIGFSNGTFTLTDTSSNGCYINQSDSALGKGNSIILNENDRIKVGRITIEVVSIDLMVSTREEVTAAKNVKNDALGLFDILSQDLNSPSTNTQSDEAKASKVSNPIPDDWDLDSLIDEPAVTEKSPAEQKTAEQELRKAEFAQDKAQNKSHQSASMPPVQQNTDNNDVFFDTLFARLQLPEGYKASVNKEDFANDIADILLHSTKGLMGLLAGRSVFKQESRLSMTMIKPSSNNPIKFALDPSDALEMLLLRKKPGYLASAKAYIQAMEDLQLHQMAFIAGLQKTLEGVLDELAPEKLEAQAKQQTTGFFAPKTSAKLWSAFEQKQSELMQSVRENLNDVLADHFSQAYENYIANASADANTKQ